MAPTHSDAAPPDATPRTVVAVTQYAPHTDKPANLALLRRQVAAAADAGAAVVVAPEYAMFAVARLDHRIVTAAEPLDGEFVTGISELAVQHGVHLIAGMVERAAAAIPGASPTNAANNGARVYNTVVVVGPDGAVVTTYRKTHLYDAFGLRESAVIAPGAVVEPATFTVDGVVFGLQTCYDLRFPEGCRRVATAGAHALLIPAQWVPGPGKVDHWVTLLRARAIENTVYVAAADHAAPRGSGASTLVDPAGSVLAQLGDSPGTAAATFDLAHLTAIRAANPALTLRRFDVIPRDPNELSCDV